MELKLLYFVIFIASIQPSHALKLEIFYETANEAVRKFFVDQLSITTLAQIEHVEVKLIPYGRTTKDEEHFTCKGGKPQCDGNKIHACFVKGEGHETAEPGKVSPAVEFVNCFFKNRYSLGNVEELAHKCMPTGIEWETIKHCFDEEATANDHFAELTAEVADQINTDGLVVRFDGVVHDTAKTNLFVDICTTLENTQGVCEHPAKINKLNVAVYYEAMDKDAGIYLSKQVDAYYHLLEEFISIDLIPYGNTLHNETLKSYKCAQGELQCISNFFQAFVVDKYIHKPSPVGDLISGPKRAFNFLTCVHQSNLGNVFKSLQKCSNEKLHSKDYQTFINHIKKKSKEFDRVLKEVRTKTQPLIANGVLTQFPMVTINGKVKYLALDNLVRQVCSQHSTAAKSDICTKALNVAVLYEPLNYKSRTLFLEHLKPVFDNLHGLVNFQLIPAGRTIEIPGAKFHCPVSDAQCNALKWQACALEFRNGSEKHTDPVGTDVFNFMVCTFKTKDQQNVTKVMENCANQHIDSSVWSAIVDCMANNTADDILRKLIKETQTHVAKPAEHKFPVVQIDNTEVADLSTIKTHICDKLETNHQPVIDFCIKASSASEKLQMQVLYESFNEPSKYFITNQLAPWYQYFEEIVNIQLLPAGNVVDHNDGKCDSYRQNSACAANKIQALIIDTLAKHMPDGEAIDGTLQSVLFVNCFFRYANYSTNIYVAAEHCLNQTSPNLKLLDLYNLLTSDNGVKIYKEVLDKTAAIKGDRPTLNPLPWITVGEEHTHVNQAANDLLHTVCNHYQSSAHDKPPECTPVQVEVYYSAHESQSQKFFKSQLVTSFNKLRERINLELIPFGVPHVNHSVEEECADKETICLSNKMHACAISKFFKDELPDHATILDGKKQTLAYVQCMLDKNITNLDVDAINSTSNDCAAKQNIVAEEITHCAHAEDGQHLLEQMESKTRAQYQSMTKSPWIVINGLQVAKAETDLTHAICDNILGDKPEYCHEMIMTRSTTRRVTTRKVTTAKPTTRKVTTKATTKKPVTSTVKPTTKKPVTSAPTPKQVSKSWWDEHFNLIIICVVSASGLLFVIGIGVLIRFQYVKVKAATKAV